MSMWRVWIRRIIVGAAIFVGLTTLVLRGLWEDRPNLDDIDWPEPEITATITGDAVTVTWLGVTTLLFDDGDTQLLIDGFFSRPTLAESVFDQPVNNDAAIINYAMNEFRMRRLAAIIPVHSHFDHAMDVGAIANRSLASVLGSESTAQIARGAGVPEEQIIVADENQPYQFGQFKVTLQPSPHAPVGWGGTVPFDGKIAAPLVMPQPVSAFRMGGAWSIVIEHPQGTSLVQGSSGFQKYALRETPVDVVFLGIGLLDSISREYAELYWQHTVTATGAHTVYPIHFDDYTKPFGDIQAGPRVLTNVVTTAKWLEEFRDRWDKDVAFYLPRFGEPIAIYASAASGS
ncbi:MAG: MBL fold metallo-hydrolase [Pseudomonadota bacterium]